MPETPADPDRKPPRFPFVALGHSVGCIVAAAWALVLYSYTVDVTPDDALHLAMNGRWRYVSVRGEIVQDVDKEAPRPIRLLAPGLDPVPVCLAQNGKPRVFVCLKKGAERPDGTHARFVGRLCVVDAVTGASDLLVVDTTRSRFTGASVAGLVVGAMGVFVFTVALRHWLRERKAGNGGTGEGRR